MTTIYTIRAVLISVCISVFAPALHAHEGHDHDKPPPLNLPVAPRVIAVTPELELVGVLSGEDRLTIFLHEFATNKPIAGARMSVSADADTIEAKSEGDGIFTVEAPWITKGASVDLIFALTLADGAEDLLTGRLEVPQSLESTAVAKTSREQSWHAGLLDDSRLLWAAVGSFMAGVLLTLLLRGGKRLPRAETPAAVPGAVENNDAASRTADSSEVTHLRRTASVVMFAMVVAIGNIAELHAAERKTAAVPSIPSTMATDQPQRMPDATVFVPKATQHLLSIRTQVAQKTKAPKTVTLSGRVTGGPQNLGRVQPNRPGRFQAAGERVGYVGMKVEAGQILGYVDTYIEAADRASIVSQIAETEARIIKNRTILSRYEARPGSVPQVKVDEVRGELQALIKKRDELLPSTSAREPLIAPIGGVISAARVVIGQVVEPRDVIFEIIDPSEFWVEATTAHPEIIENLASAVATIHDDEVVQLEYLGRGLELRNHATPLNFRAVTSQHTLGAGMTARVVLQLKEQREGIVLPTSAVVRGSTGLPIVWIKTAPERFEPQAVKTAEFDGNSVVITAGLNPDQRVVTDGVTLLNQIR